MQKNKNGAKDSFYQKYPDSDRGTMTERASFLGSEFNDDPNETGASTSFQNLNKLQMKSVTKGQKSPFSKTPRSKVGGDGSPVTEKSETAENEDESKRSETTNKKKGMLSTMLSKYLNKR
ncbi:hypothetical protein BWQ96_09704 [Gracilariopsis chorda]|uniref:Uncharacterized protein n=1 Tax=Gracilariopsis chorda TaxID=448386 RepID=A0A2V3IHI9_9FLOR|nr:hypothetical protein BWQ96_09704 [Gracilariopsis chorda]|eukprot:PXF40600.1 hypothetical protein BWQ96_09704 [Gracilariopsis chorda]